MQYLKGSNDRGVILYRYCLFQLFGQPTMYHVTERTNDDKKFSKFKKWTLEEVVSNTKVV